MPTGACRGIAGRNEASKGAVRRTNHRFTFLAVAPFRIGQRWIPGRSAPFPVRLISAFESGASSSVSDNIFQPIFFQRGTVSPRSKRGHRGQALREGTEE
jgi:hypothetical protein